MRTWTLDKSDGYYYTEDRLQRYKKRADGTVECESVPQGDSMTQQQYIDDCDVNLIMARFMKTGHIPLHVPPMLEGDFSQLPSFQEAQNIVVQAREMFMELPAKIRERFEHNPQKLQDFLADEDNRAEALKLGLINPPQEIPVDLHLQALQSISENTKPKPKPPVEE